MSNSVRDYCKPIWFNVGRYHGLGIRDLNPGHTAYKAAALTY